VLAQDQVVGVLERQPGRAAQQVERQQNLLEVLDSQLERRVALLGCRREGARRGAVSTAGVDREQQDLDALAHRRQVSASGATPP
jgi:hypothetical protein